MKQNTKTGYGALIHSELLLLVTISVLDGDGMGPEVAGGQTTVPYLLIFSYPGSDAVTEQRSHCCAQYLSRYSAFQVPSGWVPIQSLTQSHSFGFPVRFLLFCLQYSFYIIPFIYFYIFIVCFVCLCLSFLLFFGTQGGEGVFTIGPIGLRACRLDTHTLHKQINDT